MEYRKALELYRAKADEARLKGGQAISQFIGAKIAVSEISLRALEDHGNWAQANAYRPCFDWSAIRYKFRTDPKRLEMAMWSGERLCGLALGLLTSTYLELRFVEGSPATDCPLKGKRLLTALECAANYAQACGRRELRLQPINEALAELYVDVYGFVRENAKGQGQPFFKKEV